MHPRVFELLDGVTHILHAGDIVDEGDLIDLEALAPVTAVRGNVDAFGPTARYPEEARITLNGVQVHLVHQLDPLLARVDRHGWDGTVPQVLIYGHSHRGAAHYRGDTLIFNPGSAGPRRFRLIPSVGILTLDKNRIGTQLLALEAHEQEALNASA